MNVDKPVGTLKDLLGELSHKGLVVDVAILIADKLKELNKGSDLAAIKAATEELQKAFYAVSEKLYQQANPQGDANCAGDCGNCGSDGVVDADYETVD